MSEAIQAGPERRRGRPRKYGIVSERPAAVPPTASAPLPPILTPEQAASLLQVTVNSVRLMCEAGRLSAIDVGMGGKHAWRIRLCDLLPAGEAGTNWRERALRAEALVERARAMLSGSTDTGE